MQVKNNASTPAEQFEQIAKQNHQTTTVASWLAWQCQMLNGTLQGAVYSPDAMHVGEELALHPNSDIANKQLLAAARQAVKRGKPSSFRKVGYGPKKQRLCDMISCTVVHNGTVIAVVAVALSVRSSTQRKAAVQLLKWGSLWLNQALTADTNNTEQRHDFVYALSKAVATQPNLDAAAMEATNRLARGTSCARVSIGMRNGLSPHVVAISDNPQFSPETQSVRHILSAMEEAYEQESTLVYPPLRDSTAFLKHHEQLAKSASRTALLTIPLRSAEGVYGAITFERNDEMVFDAGSIKLLTSASELISETLHHKQRIEKSPITTLRDSAMQVCSNALGKNQLLPKMLLAGAVGMFVFANIISAPYKVSVPSAVQGKVQQLVAAPMASFIASAGAKAGDTVEEGQLLARLDDSALKLEHTKLDSERQQVAQQFNTALATADRAEAARLKAKMVQIESQIALVDENLQRTQLLAPFDGVVIRGDLSKSLGAPVEIGQMLFELAPLKSYTVILEVPESDISHIQSGQTAKLVVTALPEQSFDLTIEDIQPVANTNLDGNYFNVEATISGEPQELLPGMRGMSKITTESQSLWWSWTHRLRDKVSLFFWSLGLSD